MVSNDAINKPFLSICIQLFNRHETVVELLKDIPVRSDIEILVYDFSTDIKIAQKNNIFFQNRTGIQYKKFDNHGLDYGFDLLARNSQSEYCWLLPDDDLIETENFNKIISILTSNSPDFLLLNADVYTSNYKLLIKSSMHKTHKSLEIIDESNFVTIAQTLSYVGSCIFRRCMWEKYSHEKYYQSFFMHVFIFSQIINNKGNALVTNIKGAHIRANNALWTKQAFMIWTTKWPEALHSVKLISCSVLDSIVLNPSHNSIKNIVYYYAYGALSDKKFAKETLNRRYYNLYIILNFIPRAIITYLLLIFMTIKHTGIYNEPCYYLLSSIKTRTSNAILKRLFY